MIPVSYNHNYAQLTKTLCWLFIAVVFYTIGVGLFIREIILPYVFPQMHAGSGFFIGGDSINFHRTAIEVAQKIDSNGWSAWALKPTGNGGAPVGLASAIYAFAGPFPNLLLPFNAFIHALSAVLLYWIMLQFFKKPIVSLIATIPFVIFPTATYWHSQLHKDGIYILGFYAFTSIWIMLSRNEKFGLRSMGACCLLALTGLFCVWWVRDYALIVMFGLGVILCIHLLGTFTQLLSNCELDFMGACSRIIFAILILGAIKLISGSSPYKISNFETGLIMSKNVQTSDNSSPDVTYRGSLRTTKARTYSWVQSPYIPKRLDELALGLVRVHNSYYDPCYASAGSTLDWDINIGSFFELIEYLPRALQIGLLAPFPTQWFAQGGQTDAGLMRKIAGAEMIMTYVSMLFAGLATKRYWQNAAYRVALITALVMVILYAVLTPNIGTLHRMRYGFIMILVGIGAGHLFERIRACGYLSRFSSQINQ